MSAYGHAAPISHPTPSADALWRLAVRQGHIAGQDMEWVRRRYRELLREWGVDRAPEA